MSSYSEKPITLLPVYSKGALPFHDEETEARDKFTNDVYWYVM